MMPDDLPFARRVTSEDAVQYVRDLQDDLRLLTRHVARRTDRGFDGGTKPNPVDDTVRLGPACSGPIAALLTMEPAAVAADQERLASLVTQTDALSRLVWPASVNTIRLTCAYVGTSELGSLSTTIRDEAASVKRWMGCIAGIGFFTLLLAIMLLVHAGNGRAIVRDLETQRANLTDAYTALATAVQGLTLAAPTLSWDRRAAAEKALRQAGCPNDGAPHPALAAACGAKSNAERQMGITYARLKLWNAISDKLSYVVPLRWLAPDVVLPAGIDRQDWKTTELRTAGALYALTGFVLPLLLGLLGACAYVHRRVNDKIEGWALEARDKWQAALRVLLGLTLGGLLGALFTANEPVQIGGVTLSLAALAFFVGYAVQVVFTTLDGVIGAVSGKVRAVFGGP